MASQTLPVTQLQRAGERAFFDFGWLRTHHGFSFADYYDPENLNWGALRVFNDDTVAPGKGFGTHPHRDMEIVTYVLRGELEHRDSLGHAGVVAPGGIQYMSAGTGVQHSEFNHSATNPVHFVQMWVLPGKLGVKPSYGQHDFAEEERRNRWLAVASGAPTVDSPVRLMQDATLRVARLERGTLSYDLARGRFGYLFVADGEAEALGERLGAGDSLRFTGIDRIDVQGAEAELILWDVPPAGDGVPDDA